MLPEGLILGEATPVGLFYLRTCPSWWLDTSIYWLVTGLTVGSRKATKTGFPSSELGKKGKVCSLHTQASLACTSYSLKVRAGSQGYLLHPQMELEGPGRR